MICHADVCVWQNRAQYGLRTAFCGGIAKHAFLLWLKRARAAWGCFLMAQLCRLFEGVPENLTCRVCAAEDNETGMAPQGVPRSMPMREKQQTVLRRGCSADAEYYSMSESEGSL